MKKTAAVYDRWLYTLGGGEQVAFRYAQMLKALGYTTTIVTHTEIDRAKAESKLNVDLDGITLRYLPPMGSEEISKYTEEYDVFVNTSYLDYFPNRSKKGILSVFFPGKIALTPYEYLKRAFVLPTLRNLFIYPVLYRGFLYDEAIKGRIMKWMSLRSSIYFSENVSRFDIGIYFQTSAFSTLENLRFYLDSTEVFPLGQSLAHTHNTVTYVFDLKSAKGKQFTIVLPDEEYAKRVALVKLTIRSWRYTLYNAWKKFFPKWEMRLHGGPGVTKLSDLESYDKIVTISEFSQKWIQKYWGLDSTILYPTIETASFQPAPKKKNRIIHVGRFFVTGHSKKQLDLVKVFTKMIVSAQISGWELHFVGSVHDGVQHQRYFEQVKHQAEGFPVHFHTNISSDKLHDLLATSKIYWHATGLDENEDVQPILFEHFGITTVEAMASGCVPVVINAGGQKEIVTAKSGFLWNTREELLEDTLKLINDPKLLASMAIEARERSRFFDTKNGISKFQEILLD